MNRLSIIKAAVAVSCLLMIVSSAVAEKRLPDGRPIAPKTASPGQPPQIEDLACKVREGARSTAIRRMYWIAYERNGAHFAWDGPDEMTSEEASARRKRLELRTTARFGPGVTITMGVADTPTGCGFLYQSGAKSQKYLLAQGSPDYLEKRAAEIERFGGRLVSEIACRKPAPSLLSPGPDIHSAAWGSSQVSSCAAAIACLKTSLAFTGRNISYRAPPACDCTRANGGDVYCTAAGIQVSTQSAPRG